MNDERFERESVIEADHRRLMADFQEAFARCAADAHGGRIGGDEIGVLRLESFEAIHQTIESRVGDFRIVHHVVGVFVMANLVAQAFDFFSVLPLRHETSAG